MLRDVSVLRGTRDKLDSYARERATALRLAQQHLQAFSRYCRLAPKQNHALLNALNYCRENMLPDRYALTQTLCQLYEQKVLAEFWPYPPMLSPERRRFFLPFRFVRRPLVAARS